MTNKLPEGLLEKIVFMGQAFRVMLTPEDIKKRKEHAEQLKFNKQDQKKLMDEINTMFYTADVDKDDRLNKEEFKQFVTVLTEDQKAKGLKTVEITEEFLDNVYFAIDSLDGEADGITLKEFFAVVSQVRDALGPL